MIYAKKGQSHTYTEQETIRMIWNIESSHRVFLEHWNSQKSLSNIRQCFSCLLDEWIEKICKKINFTLAFWDNPHYPLLHRINLKIILGYYINYLSIWTFIFHTWISTRKASKLTFVCFQLAGWCQMLR